MGETVKKTYTAFKKSEAGWGVFDVECDTESLMGIDYQGDVWFNGKVILHENLIEVVDFIRENYKLRDPAQQIKEVDR